MEHEQFFIRIEPGAVPPVPPTPRPPAPPSGPSWSVVAGAGVLVLLVLVGLIVRSAGSRAVVAVAPAPTPTSTIAPLPLTGDGYAVWLTNADGTPVRWNPCKEIAWVANVAGAPGWALGDLEEAFSRVAAATGLTFRYEGETDERPTRHRQPYQPERYGDRWAPILVSWSLVGEGADTPLRDEDRGVAIPVTVDYEPGNRTFVSGQFVMNGARDLQPGFHDRATTWGGTFMHELGHLVGLDHVDDPAELMFPHPGNGAVFYGRGDLEGLRVIGARGGCVPSPEPQVVDVFVNDTTQAAA